ncbi:adenylosuccinate synthetase [Alishewanella longhuensis]
MRRAVQLNSISGFCLTKLDVLDGLETIQICVGYRQPDGTVLQTPPLAAEGYEVVTPVLEEMPGWSESTFGVEDLAKLPQAARNYIKRIEEVTGVPVDIISTGPDRDKLLC